MRKLITIFFTVLCLLGTASAQSDQSYETSKEAREAAEYYERKVNECCLKAVQNRSRDGASAAQYRASAEWYRTAAQFARMHEAILKSQGK